MYIKIGIGAASEYKITNGGKHSRKSLRSRLLYYKGNDMKTQDRQISLNNRILRFVFISRYLGLEVAYITGKELGMMNTGKNSGNEGDCPKQENSSRTPIEQDSETCGV